MSKTKKIMIAVASVFVITVSSLVAYDFINMTMNKTVRKDAGELNGRIDWVGPSKIGEIKTESTDAEIDKVMKLYSGKKSEQDEVIRLMLGMTQQKISINRPEVFSVQMTLERIKQLVKVIEYNHTNWDSYSELRNIAGKWETGDFSEIDDEYNELIELKGEERDVTATIATPEQEADYIKRIWGNPSIQEHQVS